MGESGCGRGRGRALKKPPAREPARAIGSKVGSFSAVSTPLIARVGAFFSIFRTRVPHLCAASFQNFALFCNFSLIFLEFYKKLRISQQIKHFSLQISRNFAGIAGNCGELPEHREFCSEFLKILIILTKFAEILRKSSLSGSSRWLRVVGSSRLTSPAFCEPWQPGGTNGKEDLGAVELLDPHGTSS